MLAISAVDGSASSKIAKVECLGSRVGDVVEIRRSEVEFGKRVSGSKQNFGVALVRRVP